MQAYALKFLIFCGKASQDCISTATHLNLHSLVLPLLVLLLYLIQCSRNSVCQSHYKNNVSFSFLDALENIFLDVSVTWFQACFPSFIFPDVWCVIFSHFFRKKNAVNFDIFGSLQHIIMFCFFGLIFLSGLLTPTSPETGVQALQSSHCLKKFYSGDWYSEFLVQSILSVIVLVKLYFIKEVS